MRSARQGAAWLLLALATGVVPAQEQDAATDIGVQADEHGTGEAPAIPSWLSLGGEFRTRFESREALGYLNGSDDGYALVRTRVDIGIDAAEWLQFGFQGQDSRAPALRESVGRLGAFEDGFDVRQAYARIGGSKSPVRVTVGRQLLSYGDQRLLGAQDWSNTSREFDAVKLELQSGQAKIDVFTASVVQNDPGRRINQSLEGNNLHGVYAALGGIVPQSTIEPFVLWQTTPHSMNELQMRGGLDRYTAGVRIWGEGLGPWDYDAAFVRQTGDVADAPIKAWGYYGELGYAIDSTGKPRLYTKYNFGSGDSDPNDGVTGGFVDVYPSAHRWYGYNDLVGWRNIRNLQLGAEVNPHKRLRLQFDFHSFWLVSARDALYNVGGRLSVAPPESGAADKKVGDEVNATFSLPVSDSVGVTGGIGYMFPGPFVKANSPGHGNTFSFLAIQVGF